MATHYDNIIVFGPTGAVGSATALEASKRGATVWIAMRDTSKPIAGLSSQQESSGKFHRLQADLSDPASVSAAVEKSQAKAAFIYQIRTDGGMKSSIQAMKDSGVEYAVFLSTYTLTPDLDVRKIPQEDFVTANHARIEVSLEDAGISFVSLRPAWFATNSFRTLDKSTSPWVAKITYGDAVIDNISPLDIGRVSGATLVDRPSKAAKEVIYLCGPKLMTQDETWEVIKSVTGKEIDLVHVEPAEYSQLLQGLGFPPILADYLTDVMAKLRGGRLYHEPLYSNAVANIKKYSGYEPTTFEEFVASQNL